jgi:hypothetical protein
VTGNDSASLTFCLQAIAANVADASAAEDADAGYYMTRFPRYPLSPRHPCSLYPATTTRGESPMADEPRPPRRPPSDYRPDLRPMLILAALLALVVAAWILISPMILPR